MIDQGKFCSLAVSDQWRLFRDDQDRLENTKIELLALRNKFENLTDEVETLRAKLVKLELIHVAAKKSIRLKGRANSTFQLEDALMGYGEEETK